MIYTEKLIVNLNLHLHKVHRKPTDQELDETGWGAPKRGQPRCCQTRRACTLSGSESPTRGTESGLGLAEPRAHGSRWLYRGPKISTLIICGDDRNSGEAEQVSLYQFQELSLHRSPLLWSWGEGHDWWSRGYAIQAVGSLRLELVMGYFPDLLQVSRAAGGSDLWFAPRVCYR